MCHCWWLACHQPTGFHSHFELAWRTAVPASAVSPLQPHLFCPPTSFRPPLDNRHRRKTTSKLASRTTAKVKMTSKRDDQTLPENEIGCLAALAARVDPQGLVSKDIDKDNVECRPIAMASDKTQDGCDNGCKMFETHRQHQHDDKVKDLKECKTSDFDDKETVNLLLLQPSNRRLALTNNNQEATPWAGECTVASPVCCGVDGFPCGLVVVKRW